MPAVTPPIDALALGPGFLFTAPLASALPTNTVAGSVFTDAWPGAWLLFGATAEGSTFGYEPKYEGVEVEEYLDPVKWVASGREVGIQFALAQLTQVNMKRAFNGGTTTSTGATTTLLTKLTPPALGAEVRCMIGWESTDSTERLYAESCLQVGQVAVQRRKGVNKATIPVEFKFEQPATGFPFTYLTAGSVRA